MEDHRPSPNHAFAPSSPALPGEKLAHQAGSDVILQVLPASPTQRPEVRAVKVQAGNNIR